MRTTVVIFLSIVIFSGVSVRAETYNLDAFLSKVEKHSKDLKLAQKDVETAGQQKREAIATALPQIRASAGYNRYLSDYYTYFDMSGTGDLSKIRTNRENSYSAGIYATQTLFSLQVGSAIKAARQYQKLTDFIYDASNQQILTLAKTAFYQTLLLEQVWQVARESEKNAHENYVSVENEFTAGLASEYELLQAEVRYKNLIPQTTAAQRDYEIALVNLAFLVGIGIDEDFELDGSLEDYPEVPPALPIDAILNDRPDYQALLWEEKLRRTNVTAERSSFFPTLEGTFAYNYSAQSDRWSLDEENNTYTVGLNLSLTIFTGGSRKAKVKKAQIEVDKTRLRIDQAREGIEKEIKSIRLRLEESRSRINSAEATLEAASKAFSIAEATAKSGLTTQLQLKDSRVVLDAAKVGYYGAIFEYLAAYFDWERATGLRGEDNRS